MFGQRFVTAYSMAGSLPAAAYRGRTGEEITGNERKRMNTKYSTDKTDAPVGASSWERPQEPFPPINDTSHHAAARSLVQMFSLYPLLAFFIILVDAMVSAVDVATLGITAPALWLIASLFSGAVVFMGQKKWGGDDQESAIIKALIVGFLVALPTPFPAFLTVPSAVMGVVQTLRRQP
jgi:hypothetical protein